MRAPHLLLLITIAASAAACAKAQARTEPALPELAPPAPPPRVIATYPDETTKPAEPAPAETAANAPAPRATAKPPVRTEAPPKPEPTPAEPDRASAPPPALTLKPAPGAEALSTETSIRSLLGRASRDLARVNYQTLNADGKAQYDTAKRFLQQAEEALRGGNLVFAGKLADKAATMAAVLVR